MYPIYTYTKGFDIFSCSILAIADNLNFLCKNLNKYLLATNNITFFRGFDIAKCAFDYPAKNWAFQFKQISSATSFRITSNEATCS